MKITNLHAFLVTYFEAYQCSLLYNENGVLTVELTEEIDRTLMNRPFYWHFIKNSGQAGEPATLTLITNPERRDEQGEWIHFGSPRLQQIFNHLKESHNTVKLFQQVETNHHTALHPWLIVNIKINYVGKQNKEELFSIGLNLITGTMKTEMMHLLDILPLANTISDFCYPVSPLIKLSSGFKRIEKVIDQYLTDQPHNWATESIAALQDEIHVVEHFFQEDDSEDKLLLEINDLKKRYTPTLSYQVINGGVIYLVPPPV